LTPSFFALRGSGLVNKIAASEPKGERTQGDVGLGRRLRLVSTSQQVGKRTPRRAKSSGTVMSGCGGAQALHTAQRMPWESLR